MGRLLRGGTAWATVLAASALGHTAETNPVWRRHDREIAAIEYRVRHPERRLNHEIGSLTEPEFRARALAIARDLEVHLRDPALTVFEKNVVLGILARLRDLAAPTAGTLAQILHAYDQDRSMNIPYFCTVTRTMAVVAPRDPVVIRALANALAQEAGSGLCHRCGCALEALQAAGPAAAPIAGPVLVELARKPRFMTSNSDQLGKAIEAIGARDAMALTLFERVRSAEIAPDDRIATLRALAKSYPNLSAETQAQFADVAEGLLDSDELVVRTAGAETLALSGPRALTALMRGLKDAHYMVRAASARSLARLGPAASPARSLLIGALDPFLGTGEAAAEALVALGPEGAAEVEARVNAAPPHVRPLMEATVRAVRAGDLAPVREVLGRAYTRGPNDIGYVRIDVLSEGRGTQYESSGRRIRVHVRGRPYPSSAEKPVLDETLTADGPPNAFYAALAGRRDGDRLRLLMSPEVAQSPYASTHRWNEDHTVQHLLPAGSGAVFDVDIRRVCEPVIWTVFRGSGIWGEVKFELYCR